MPRGDRTGPIGLGPRTGRHAGFCAGYPVPGYANPVWGRGGRNSFGPGFWKAGTAWLPGAGGFHGGTYPYGGPSSYWPGWGRCRWFSPDVPYPAAQPYSPSSTKEEHDFLKEQAKALEAEINSIRERIKEIEGSSGDDK